MATLAPKPIAVSDGMQIELTALHSMRIVCLVVASFGKSTEVSAGQYDMNAYVPFITSRDGIDTELIA